MGGRSLAPFLLAAAVLVGACSESANDVPTAPQFAAKPPPPSCSFTTVSSLVKNEFGASSTESGLATDMKNAGAQTAQATSLGYQILASIGGKYDGSQTSTSNAAQLTVALLRCMSIGTTTVPDTAVFKSALAGAEPSASGPSWPRTSRPWLSHDDGWLLEASGNRVVAGCASGRHSGSGARVRRSVGAGGFTNDVAKSGVFEWSTIPEPLTFNEPGVVIGECQADPRYLQHNSAATTPEVLGFISPDCLTISGLGARAEDLRRARFPAACSGPGICRDYSRPPAAAAPSVRSVRSR